MVRGRCRGAGGRHDLGQQTRRAVLAHHGGLAGLAGGDSRRIDVGTGRHRWWADHWCWRKAVRSFPWPFCGRRHRDLVCLCVGPRVSAISATGFVWRKDYRPRLAHIPHNEKHHVLQRKRPVQDFVPGGPADLSDHTRPCRRIVAARGSLRGGADGHQRVHVSGDSDSVCDHVLGCLGSKPSGGVLRADFARFGCFHGGGCLRRF